jgi:hypothetical protein
VDTDEDDKLECGACGENAIVFSVTRTIMVTIDVELIFMVVKAIGDRLECEMAGLENIMVDVDVLDTHCSRPPLVRRSALGDFETRMKLYVTR